MFKSRKVFYSILIIIAMIFTGCVGSGTVFVDQNDEVLPKTFTNLYIFMDYSSDFSDFVGNITADLYSKGFITEQEKNKIGEI